MPFDNTLLHYGIFGPGLSGKTTLAKQLSRFYWRKDRIKSLVLDPNNDSDWGPQAWVTNDEDLFWDMVWYREVDCALFVEEAAETIARDNSKTSLFTRVRHRRGPNGPGHRLHIIGHSGSNLLPQQRDQVHTLYLFKQTPKSADIWAEQFCDKRIMKSCYLNKYEFLFCRLHEEPKAYHLYKV